MNIEEEWLYVSKCGKSMLKNYRITYCDWSGALIDYVYHVKQSHPESFHRLRQRQTEFSWTSDVVDKLEIAILSYQNSFYLYKFHYHKGSGRVSHEVRPIQQEEDTVVEVGDGQNEKVIAFVRTPCEISHREGNYRSLRWFLRISNLLID